MAFVVSNWEIMYDVAGSTPYTFVNWGDEIDEEISFPWAQRVDTSKPLRAVSSIKFGRGQVEQSFTVGIWKTHASQAAARNYLLARATAVPTGVSKNLRIRVKDGNNYQMPTCVVASGDGHLVTKVGVVRTWEQYKFEGGKIVQI